MTEGVFKFFIVVSLLVTLSHCQAHYVKELWRCSKTKSGCGDKCTFSNNVETCEFRDLSTRGCLCGGLCPRQPFTCTCRCRRDCQLNEVDQMGLATSCNIMPIENVDHQIGLQIQLNIVQALAGNIPGAGAVFDTIFAIWSPFSPVSSPFSLADMVIDEMNKLVDELKQCMDQKISNAKIVFHRDTVVGLTSQYNLVFGATGSVLIDHMTNLFGDFVREMSSIFGTPESNHFEYENMLPIFEALYPLFYGLSFERLIYLASINDESNYNNEYNNMRIILETGSDWLILARASIENHIRTSLLSLPCRNIDSIVNNWKQDFNSKYIATFNDIKNDIEQLTFNNIPIPTPRPTSQPTIIPTSNPTVAPTIRTTERPTKRPTKRPTDANAAKVELKKKDYLFKENVSRNVVYKLVIGCLIVAIICVLIVLIIIHIWKLKKVKKAVVYRSVPQIGTTDEDI